MMKTDIALFSYLTGDMKNRNKSYIRKSHIRHHVSIEGYSRSITVYLIRRDLNEGI